MDGLDDSIKRKDLPRNYNFHDLSSLDRFDKRSVLELVTGKTVGIDFQGKIFIGKYKSGDEISAGYLLKDNRFHEDIDEPDLEKFFRYADVSGVYVPQELNADVFNQVFQGFQDLNVRVKPGRQQDLFFH